MIQAVNGIILLDKAAGASSAQAIAAVKRRLGLSKIGHAGTLDPDATGLLVCLVGKATRVARFAEDGRKVYSGTMALGVRTTTDDMSGEVLERSTELPDDAALAAAVGTFIGELQQVPPQVSAVHVHGERAYDLVRKGISVALDARTVTVFRFDVERTAPTELRFEIECSKGTYIRSLARDLGALLGCGGALHTLRREASFPFSVAEAKPIEELSGDDIISWERLFPSIPLISLNDELAVRVYRGDEHALREVSRSFLDGVTTQQVIYRGETQEAPLGILQCQDSGWEIGVNL